MVAESVAPVLVLATMVAIPAASPVATPAVETEATDGEEDFQVTDATPIESPNSFSVAALSVTDCPTRIVELLGRTRSPVASSFGVVGALQAISHTRTTTSRRMIVPFVGEAPVPPLSERPGRAILLRPVARGSAYGPACRARKAATFARLPHAEALQKRRR